METRKNDTIRYPFYLCLVWIRDSIDLQTSNICSTTTISGKGHLMRVEGQEFSGNNGHRISSSSIVILESLLSAHEDWVYSVAWQPPRIKDGKLHQPSVLLSASMDRRYISLKFQLRCKYDDMGTFRVHWNLDEYCNCG